MTIETQRLLLKPYEAGNIHDYHLLMSNSLVWTYSSVIPHERVAQSEQKLRDVIQGYASGSLGFHALFEKSTGAFIGEAGILSLNRTANRCVIGYNLLPAHWGKGYATEISQSLIGYAFDVLLVERVEALAQKANAASCKVLEKSGMLREGMLRHFAKVRGAYEDVCYYAIISSDRPNMRS